MQNESHLFQRQQQVFADILRQLELSTAEIEKLNEQIRAREASMGLIERSLAESDSIARKMESEAHQKAADILAKAETVVASRRLQLAMVEQEIEALNEELHAYQQRIELVVARSKGNQSPAKDAAGRTGSGAFSYTEKVPAPENDSLYFIKLVSFLNARHYVTFEAGAGPVHAHSWQVAIEVKVPPGNAELVAFTRIFAAINAVLSSYENTVLNEVYPFNLIQPSTENIAMWFFNRIEDAMQEIELGLGRLTLWETPTRGIEVTVRRPDFDEIRPDQPQLQEVFAFHQEAAPASDVAASALAAVDNELGKSSDSGVFPPAATEVAALPARQYSFRQYAMAVAILCLVTLLAYHNVLSPPWELRYPWGSDTWGHLFKADYLYNEILQGNYCPQFTEYWYNGSQPFRYWAPLPYYILALLRALSGDIFIAGGWYIFGCALLGGLSWLLFAPRMGLWPAVMAGIVWSVWIDNVRVAFSEGNLPRVLATALLPLLVFAFVRLLEKRKSWASIIGVAVLIHLIILCHAMIGAVYCLCLTGFAIGLWVYRGCGFKDCVRGMVVLAAGIATSCWWLLPSLTGGITGVDVQAVKEAIQFVPAAVSLNPLHRFTNQETFYWGISILLAIGVSLFGWRSKPAWAKSLILCGIILVLITFPFIRALYVVLPLSHLLWPLRFSSFAALGILAGSLSFNLPLQRQRLLQPSYITGALVASLFLLLVFDCFLSARSLIYTGTRPFNVLQSAQLLNKSPGWRVATIDLSQLGSAPSYTFSEVNGLEQVFGWAWQGAVTSNNIMLLNTGLESQYYPFLLRSCVNLGATDLIVKEDVLKKPSLFRDACHQAGYQQQALTGGISVWHANDSPYLIKKENRCLVIGRYAGTLALQFPEVEMGVFDCIDKYPASYLQKYPKIILSGARWWSQSRAEQLMSDYVSSGGKLYVELAGMPENVLAKQPEFMGVYGEPVTPRGGLSVFGSGKRFLLQPFSSQEPVWKSYVPLGLDKVELEFSYYGNQAPIYGYKLINGNKVWFLGGNLIFHTFLTRDAIALEILKEVLELKPDYVSPELIPLTKYRASERGYEMSYQADQGFNAIVPVAAIEGIEVRVDGILQEVKTFENLIELSLPAGEHSIAITLTRTPIYRWGMIISLLSGLLMLAGLVWLSRTGEVAE